MKKPALSDFAFWAALPMAHTSKIESRLTRILDNTRCRTLPRRVFVLSVAIGAAALVPLAMLRPDAKAQTAMPRPVVKAQMAMLRPVAESQTGLPPFLMIQGVHDINVHHADEGWWDVDGKFLPGAVYDAEPFQLNKDLFSSTNVLNRRFVFRSSEDLLGDHAVFVPSGALVYQTSYRKAQWNVTASFPLTAKTTNITVGTASGPWSEAATLNYHRGQPVPFEIDGPSRIGPDLDAADDNRIVFSVPARSLHDLHEFQAVAVSTGGHETTLPKVAAFRNAFMARGREEVTVSLPHLLSRLQFIRVDSRPYDWEVFKNIALQPVKYAIKRPVGGRDLRDDTARENRP